MNKVGVNVTKKDINLYSIKNNFKLTIFKLFYTKFMARDLGVDWVALYRIVFERLFIILYNFVKQATILCSSQGS